LKDIETGCATPSNRLENLFLRHTFGCVFDTHCMHVQCIRFRLGSRSSRARQKRNWNPLHDVAGPASSPCGLRGSSYLSVQRDIQTSTLFRKTHERRAKFSIVPLSNFAQVLNCFRVDVRRPEEAGSHLPSDSTEDRNPGPILQRRSK